MARKKAKPVRMRHRGAIRQGAVSGEVTATVDAESWRALMQVLDATERQQQLDHIDYILSLPLKDLLAHRPARMIGR